jgi:hypothetical protein
MATTVFDFLDTWNIDTHQITSINTSLPPFIVTYSGSIPVGGPLNYTDGNDTAHGGTYDGTNPLGDLIFHNGGSYEVLTNSEYAIGDPITVDAQPFFRTISASGVWGPCPGPGPGPGPCTPDTPFSQPDASWSFSFDLPNPFSSNPTNQATHFSYVMNGNAVSDTLFMPFVTVKFFPADEAGMFDLTFSNGDVVSLYGADIGTSLTLAPGVYFAAAGMEMKPATGIGIVTVSALGPVVTGFGAVPEPSTWVMMALGFAVLAFAGYRTRRRVAPSRSAIAGLQPHVTLATLGCPGLVAHAAERERPGNGLERLDANGDLDHDRAALSGTTLSVVLPVT